MGTHEYPEMVHGWTVRGDITDEKVKRDTSDAIMRCRKYFDKLEWSNRFIFDFIKVFKFKIVANIEFNIDPMNWI